MASADCLLTLLPGAAPATAMPHQSRRTRARTGTFAATALLFATCCACSLLAQRSAASGPEQGLGFLAPPPASETQSLRRNVGNSAPIVGASAEMGYGVSTVAGACLLASAAVVLARTQPRKKNSTALRATGDKIPLEGLKVGDEFDGEVTRVANMGVWVNIGSEKDALLPKSDMKGKTYKVKDKIEGLRITEVQAGETPATRKIRVSLTKDSSSVKVGDTLDGEVSNVSNFGVFFSCGLDKDVLVPKSGLADSDTNLKAGDKRKVKIMQIDEDGKLSGSTDTSAAPKKETGSLKVGESVSGKVTNVADFGLFVDIGTKREALVRSNQLEKELGEYKVGDKITGLRVITVDAAKNQVQLSTRPLPSEVNVGDKLEGTVARKAEFGLFLDAGLAYDVLCPSKFLEKKVEEYSEGQVVDVTITEITDNRITVSEKGETSVANVVPGSQVSGTIKAILPNVGLFIDAGLVQDALLPRGRASKPMEEYSVGDEIDSLAVIRVDIEKSQIELTDLKKPVGVSGRSLSDIQVGETVQGTVTRVAPFGVFVDIGAERDALYANSQLELGKSEYKQGMEITGLRVSDVDPVNSRLAVSKKTLASAYEVGQAVTGKITKKMAFGAFIDIGASVEALLPNALMDDELDSYSEGQELTNLKITRISVEENRISVGQKESERSSLMGGEVRKITDLQPGEKVKGVVRLVREYGVFVDIGLGRKDALMPNSQLGSRSVDEFEPNQAVEVYIGQVNVALDRVTLCIDPPPEGGIATSARSSMQAGDIPKGEVLPDPDWWKAFLCHNSMKPTPDDIIDDEPVDWHAWAKKFPGLVKFPEKEVEIYLCSHGLGFMGIDQQYKAHSHFIPMPVHLRKPDAGPAVIPSYKFDSEFEMGYDYGIKQEIHRKWMTPPMNNPDWLAPGVKPEDVAKAKAALEAKQAKQAKDA